MLKAFHMNDINEIWIGRNELEVKEAYLLNDEYLDEDEFYELTSKDVLNTQVIDQDTGKSSTLYEIILEAERDYSGPFSACCDAAYA